MTCDITDPVVSPTGFGHLVDVRFPVLTIRMAIISLPTYVFSSQCNCFFFVELVQMYLYTNTNDRSICAAHLLLIIFDYFFVYFIIILVL